MADLELSCVDTLYVDMGIPNCDCKYLKETEEMTTFQAIEARKDDLWSGTLIKKSIGGVLGNGIYSSTNLKSSAVALFLSTSGDAGAFNKRDFRHFYADFLRLLTNNRDAIADHGIDLEGHGFFNEATDVEDDEDNE